MRMAWMGSSTSSSAEAFTLAGLDTTQPSNFNEVQYDAISNTIHDYVMSPDGSTQILLHDNQLISSIPTDTAYVPTHNLSGGGANLIGLNGGSAGSIFVNPNGIKLYTSGKINTVDDNIIREYDMGTAWDASSLSNTQNELDLTDYGINFSIGSIHISDDGTTLTLLNSVTRAFHKFNLAIPWELNDTGIAPANVTLTHTSPSTPAYFENDEYLRPTDWTFDNTGSSIIFCGELLHGYGFKRISVGAMYDIESGMTQSPEGTFGINMSGGPTSPIIGLDLTANNARIIYVDENNVATRTMEVSSDTYYTTGFLSMEPGLSYEYWYNNDPGWRNIQVTSDQFLHGAWHNPPGAAELLPAEPSDYATINTYLVPTPSDILEGRGITANIRNLPANATVTGIRVHSKLYNIGNLPYLYVSLNDQTYGNNHSETLAIGATSNNYTGGPTTMWSELAFTKQQLLHDQWGWEIQQRDETTNWQNAEQYDIHYFGMEVFYTLP